jgi:diacylglycerol kinase family enzyme
VPKIASFSSKQELIDIHVTPDNRVYISAFKSSKAIIKTYIFEGEPSEIQKVKNISNINRRFYKETPRRLAILVNPISGKK